MSNRNPVSPSSSSPKPSREQLLAAAERAAKIGEALLAQANEMPASGPVVVAPPGRFNQRGTRDWDKPLAAPEQQARAGVGPGALQTGHGMARAGNRRTDGHAAFEEFMDELSPSIQRGGNRLRVTLNEGYVKIESLHNGHKVYIAKGVTTVSRVESTIPPSMLDGAAEPDRPNGRIASWIRADVQSVSKAIDFLVDSDEMIVPPRRGGGDTAIDQQRRVQVDQPAPVGYHAAPEQQTPRYSGRRAGQARVIRPQQRR